MDSNMIRYDYCDEGFPSEEENQGWHLSYRRPGREDFSYLAKLDVPLDMSEEVKTRALAEAAKAWEANPLGHKKRHFAQLIWIQPIPGLI